MPIRHEGSDSRLLISAEGVFSASEGREGRRSGTPRPERKKRLHVRRCGPGRSSAAQRNRLEISKNEGKKLAVGIYLHDLADGFQTRRVIGEWIDFYNAERPHSALGGKPRPRPTAATRLRI